MALDGVADGELVAWDPLGRGSSAGFSRCSVCLIDEEAAALRDLQYDWIV